MESNKYSHFDSPYDGRIAVESFRKDSDDAEYSLGCYMGVFFTLIAIAIVLGPCVYKRKVRMRQSKIGRGWNDEQERIVNFQQIRRQELLRQQQARIQVRKQQNLSEKEENELLLSYLKTQLEGFAMIISEEDFKLSKDICNEGNRNDLYKHFNNEEEKKSLSVQTVSPLDKHSEYGTKKIHQDNAQEYSEICASGNNTSENDGFYDKSNDKLDSNKNDTKNVVIHNINERSGNYKDIKDTCNRTCDYERDKYNESRNDNKTKHQSYSNITDRRSLHENDEVNIHVGAHTDGAMDIESGEYYDRSPIAEDMDNQTRLLCLPLPGVPLSSHDDQNGAAITAIQNKTRLKCSYCAVCLDRIECGQRIVWSSNTDCPHLFHEGCILSWFLHINQKHKQNQQFSPTIPLSNMDDRSTDDGNNNASSSQGGKGNQPSYYNLLCPCCRQTFILNK